MTMAVLVAETSGGSQIEQITRTFGVDWPHLISQIISFAIVCGLLYLFAYKPVLRMLAQRRELIEQGLANSKKIKAELAKTEQQRQEILGQAVAEAANVVEEARIAARHLRDQETRKAKAAAEQILTNAQDSAASEHLRMLSDLKKEVGRLVVKTTSAITGRILSNDDQQRLAEETARVLRAQ